MGKPRFSKNLKVVFRSRGRDSGDYGVGFGDRLVAEMEWFGYESKPGLTPDLLPAYENAVLFAAAPDLFAACEEAIRVIEATTKDEKLLAKLKSARDKALPKDIETIDVTSE